MPEYGLIFDVDGVIGNTEPVNARATIQVLEEMLGLEGMRAADFAEGFGRGAAKYTEVGAARHGVKLSAEQLARAVAERAGKILEIIRREGLPTFPGVLELARACQADSRFRVGIASSAEPELVYAILEAVKFPYEGVPVLTGENVKKKKPDPEIFLLTAQSIGIAPPHGVVVEDAPDGVSAARAAGCRCIGVTNSVVADKLAQADRVVSDLVRIGPGDLIDLIKS